MTVHTDGTGRARGIVLHPQLLPFQPVRHGKRAAAAAAARRSTAGFLIEQQARAGFGAMIRDAGSVAAVG